MNLDRFIPSKTNLNDESLRLDETKKSKELIVAMLSQRILYFPKIDMVISEKVGYEPIVEPRWGIVIEECKDNKPQPSRVVVATPFELTVGESTFIKGEEWYKSVPVYSSLLPLLTEEYHNMLEKTIEQIREIDLR